MSYSMAELATCPVIRQFTQTFECLFVFLNFDYLSCFLPLFDDHLCSSFKYGPALEQNELDSFPSPSSLCCSVIL